MDRSEKLQKGVNLAFLESMTGIASERWRGRLMPGTFTDATIKMGIKDGKIIHKKMVEGPISVHRVVETIASFLTPKEKQMFLSLYTKRDIRPKEKMGSSAKSLKDKGFIEEVTKKERSSEGVVEKKIYYHFDLEMFYIRLGIERIGNLSIGELRKERVDGLIK